MQNFISRLKEYLDKNNLKVRTVERTIGVANGTLSKPLTNNKTIKVDTLEKFLTFYNDINLNWLFYGREPMIIQSNSELNLPVESLEMSKLRMEIFELKIRLDECRRKNEKEIIKKAKE